MSENATNYMCWSPTEQVERRRISAIGSRVAAQLFASRHIAPNWTELGRVPATYDVVVCREDGRSVGRYRVAVTVETDELPTEDSP